MDELRRIGLQRVWLDIAETVGVDTFLLVWRLLDADPAARPSGESSLRVTIRSYATYMRYQRNRYIETLADEGKTAQQIRQIIKRDLCETLSLRHIERLMVGG